MSTTKSFSWTNRIETVLDELATIMEAEATAERVGSELINKFNHLVNTWNKARPRLNKHRSDRSSQPAPSIQVENRIIEVAAPPVNVSMGSDLMVGVERPPVNFIKLTFGFINLNTISLLDVKSRQVYINGLVKSLEREDVVKLVHWMKVYKAQ